MIGIEDFLKLKNLIGELAMRSENGSVIIVEGLKDVASLRTLGIKGDIITSSSISDVAVVDRVKNKDVVILTDHDRRGDLLEKNLVNKFSSWGVIPDVEFKKKIFSIARDINSIENLARYYEKVKVELKVGDIFVDKR
jgi:5S rRNA maturation endonuclease (ribonuclease M5)